MICGFEVSQVITGFNSISTNIIVEQPNEMNISLSSRPSLSIFRPHTRIMLLHLPTIFEHETRSPNSCRHISVSPRRILVVAPAAGSDE